jgi:hypothetical protein
LELPEYVGYCPSDGRSWRSLKEDFYLHHTYSCDNPLLINIQRDNHVLGVYVYGFKIPDPCMVVSLGTNAAICGRVALCKLMLTGEFIAIAW